MKKPIWFVLFLPVFVLLISCRTAPSDDHPEERPNIVLIYFDDLGYGDLGVYGHPTIRTPVMDRLASEGQKWTSFYSASSKCTPSRAALLTGRYQIRTGVTDVFFPADKDKGLPPSEITMAERLRDAGYATTCIGKWHLGHRKPYLPTNQGFDSYYGIPYSNDMSVDAEMPLAEDVRFRNGMTRESFRNLKNKSRDEKKKIGVPLMKDEKIIEYPVNQDTITKRYTQKAVEFIRSNRDHPFFLYLPYTAPHTPLHVSDEFRGTSERGLYGDEVEELDWSVGRVIDALKKWNLEQETLVIVTSDNGPWTVQKQDGGSPGMFRGYKGTTFEGGVRVPAIFWGPGYIEPGVVTQMGSTLDLYVTALTLAGAEVPSDRPIDGKDLRPVLSGTGESPRDRMVFYKKENLYAIRKGPFKAHFTTIGHYKKGANIKQHDPPLLYHIGHDPAEQYNVADEHPDVIREIHRIRKAHRATLKEND